MLNSAERSLIPKLQHIENSNSLAPKAVYLLKTGTKLNNKLNLSTSSWLGLNKHLFLRQQKTHFILIFFLKKKVSFQVWRWFFFPAAFSFAVNAIKDAIQFKWLQLTPNSEEEKKKRNNPSFLNPTADKQTKARFYWTLSSFIWSTAEIIHTCRTGTQTLNPAKCFLLVCIKDKAIKQEIKLQNFT